VHTAKYNFILFNRVYKDEASGTSKAVAEHPLYEHIHKVIMLTAVDPNTKCRNLHMYREFRRTEEGFPDFLKKASTLDYDYVYS
jgi:hypothetical protein